MSAFFSKMFGQSKKAQRPADYRKGEEEFKIGCSFAQKRQDEEAVYHLDVAIKNGITQGHEQRAYCLQSMGFLLDAIDDFSIAIDLNPTDCNLYFCRGVCRQAIGQLALAIADKHLAIEYSKVKSEINSRRDEIARAQGSESLTAHYELIMALWENELGYDIQMADKIEKLKKTGREADIQFANQLLSIHTGRWESKQKRR